MGPLRALPILSPCSWGGAPQLLFPPHLLDACCHRESSFVSSLKDALPVSGPSLARPGLCRTYRVPLHVSPSLPPCSCQPARDVSPDPTALPLLSRDHLGLPLVVVPPAHRAPRASRLQAGPPQLVLPWAAGPAPAPCGPSPSAATRLREDSQLRARMPASPLPSPPPSSPVYTGPVPLT